MTSTFEPLQKWGDYQQIAIAEWMVSQKAFKELAIQFGEEKGLSAEEVIQMGNNKEIDVLEDKHDPSHNTNTDHKFFKPYKDKLKDKLINPRVEETLVKMRGENESI